MVIVQSLNYKVIGSWVDRAELQSWGTLSKRPTIAYGFARRDMTKSGLRGAYFKVHLAAWYQAHWLLGLL